LSSFNLFKYQLRDFYSESKTPSPETDSREKKKSKPALNVSKPVPLPRSVSLTPAKMQHLLFYLSVVVVLVLATLPSHIDAVQCYTCVTQKANWKQEKCGVLKDNCLFCTKAEFGGSLVVRGCALGGAETSFTQNNKMCGKYRTYLNGLKDSNPMKILWKKFERYFLASCKTSGTKEPKKGYTCKKNKCNGAPSATSLSSALLMGVLTLGFFTLH